jgi:hypothetical protein
LGLNFAWNIKRKHCKRAAAALIKAFHKFIPISASVINSFQRSQPIAMLISALKSSGLLVG